MEPGAITIEPLGPGSADLETCAAWRFEAFRGENLGTLADNVRLLEALTQRPRPPETVLVARVDGQLAGLCLLELDEPVGSPSILPWLTSLYVAPAFRSRGIARRLIAAIESHARAGGVDRLSLYTSTAEALYRSCGWECAERFRAGGVPFVLMTRKL